MRMRGLVLCALLGFANGQSSTTAAPREWSYSNTSAWCDEGYPTCCGQHQSPIALSTYHATPNTFAPFKFSQQYFSFVQGHIVNNGHSAQFNPDNSTAKMTVTGGPLGGAVYQFAQFHFHWGDNDYKGSEHRLNGQSFAGELHLVHRNVKYNTTDEALLHPDGLAVIGMFLEPGWRNPNNPDSQNIQDVDDTLTDITDVDATTSLDIDIGAYFSSLPADPEYFAYKGSLTTPGCNEVVTWTVFEKPIYIAEKQLSAFRHIKDHQGHLLQDNFRPDQPLNNRILYVNRPRRAIPSWGWTGK